MRGLIATSLFSQMYSRGKDGGAWELNRKIASPKVTGTEMDWIRLFVGVARALFGDGGGKHKMTIISFNYDMVFEFLLRRYWAVAERTYPAVDECFEFIYPHGSFLHLPNEVVAPRTFLLAQAKNIRLGGSAEEVPKRQAQAAIAAAEKIYSVGFSFAKSNMELLGIDAGGAPFYKMYIQNYKRDDKRLERVVRERGYQRETDDGDMTALIRSGFFEQ